MIAKLTRFGNTLHVKVTPHNGATPDDYDDVLWAWRDEDRYALMSKQYKGKKVLEVDGRDWAAAHLAHAIDQSILRTYNRKPK